MCLRKYNKIYCENFNVILPKDSKNISIEYIEKMVKEGKTNLEIKNTPQITYAQIKWMYR